MSIRRNPFVLLPLLSVLLQGCSSTPRFNDHFGDSVRANLSAQVIHPENAANTNPASGVDGAAARAAQERYQSLFKENGSGNERPLVGGSGSQ
jgi:type IV pilus biogenesis protein CpaD/CtpE